MYRILCEMYKNVKSCVSLDGNTTTEYFDCQMGVRQGCQLSPFLFSMFLNDMEDELSSNNDISGVSVGLLDLYCLLFADDLVLFAETAIKLQRVINAVDTYCHKWKLTVNLSKTKIIVFRRGGYLRNYEKWFLSGEQISVQPVYKYLGVHFTVKGIWTKTQSSLADQASKALFILKKHMFQFTNVPISVWMKLFDSKIKPILEYGAEIWGFHPAGDIEVVQTKFCKFVLRLGRNAPNIAALGELGRNTMYSQRLCKIIKYWFKLLHANENRYIKNCYSYQYELSENGRECWCSDLKKLLYHLGFGVVWVNQGVGNEELFMIEFNQRVIDIDCQQWHDKLTSLNKLDTYRLFKNNLSCEKYTSVLEKQKYITVLAKFRCSNHTLMVEKGRQLGLPRQNRICQFCSLNLVEDEVHFLVECPLFEDLRCNHNITCSPNISSAHNFIRMMTNSNVNHLRNVCRFLLSAERRREDFNAL